MQAKNEVKASRTKEDSQLSKSMTEVAKSLVAPSTTTDMRLTKVQSQKLERSIKWEKTKVEKAVKQIIFKEAENLVHALIDIGINDRNPAAINSLLDRGFGKASQNIEIDAGQGNRPIIFLPAELMIRHSIEQPSEQEIKKLKIHEQQ